MFEVLFTEPPPLKGNSRLPILLGVAGGREASTRLEESERSALLPTRMRVRSGLARARASFMKEERFWKVECEEMS
jgi:hypothetical protein